MSDRFTLRVVTPSRLLLDEQVREVTAPGSVGEFGVLPDHITFLSSLEIGTLSYRTDQGVRRVAIRGGFAEVADNVMTVLVDDAVFADDVDTAVARRDADAAVTALQPLSPIDPDFAAADADRRWAEARIHAASGRP